MSTLTDSAKCIFNPANQRWTYLCHMGDKLKKGIGVVLGLVVLLFASRYFLYSYRDGDPKWFMLVMVFGMVLILYYTVTSARRDDDDYS